MKNQNITFVIPVLNNFRYTKHIYNNLKKYYPEDEIIISDGGSTDETIEYFSNILDSNLNFIANPPCNSCVNINSGIKAAINEVVIFIHNDMVIPPNFKEKILQDIAPNRIISYTRIEPPVFPDSMPGKVIMDLGYDLDDFKENQFLEYVNNYNIKDQGGSQLFIAFYKKDYLNLDEVTFCPPQMFCADDDLHLRFNLMGYEKFISDACVYHFVSKSTRITPNNQTIEHQSNINFIKKWGFRNSIYNVVYKKSIKINNSNTQLEQILEPWFNDGNDIIVEVDGNKFTQDDFQIIQQLNDIIKENGTIGSFELNNLKITINSMNEYQNTLIKI
jgi:GT2 family glycosyltransferase